LRQCAAGSIKAGANDSDILTSSFTIACEIYHYHGLYAKNDTDYPRQ